MTTELSQILSADELDLDAKLRSYQRKIHSMRAAADVPTITRTKRRLAADRSAAVDYRNAKLTATRLRVISISQVLTLALMASLLVHGTLLLLVLLFALGAVSGYLASFARIQRWHYATTALNVTYFCASSGTACACVLLLISAAAHEFTSLAIILVILAATAHSAGAFYAG